MKCLILAAGYATRLYPLTENFPKPLLEIKGKSIIDWLVDDISESNTINEFIIVSNHRFINFFEKWKNNKKFNTKITIIDDGTTNNENRLGAVVDIELAISKLNIAEDLMVIAGDNVLDFSLCKFIEYFKTKKATCVMRYYEEDLNNMKESFDNCKIELTINMLNNNLKEFKFTIDDNTYYGEKLGDSKIKVTVPNDNNYLEIEYDDKRIGFTYYEDNKSTDQIILESTNDFIKVNYSYDSVTFDLDLSDKALKANLKKEGLTANADFKFESNSKQTTTGTIAINVNGDNIKLIINNSINYKDKITKKDANGATNFTNISDEEITSIMSKCYEKLQEFDVLNLINNLAGSLSKNKTNIEFESVYAFNVFKSFIAETPFANKIKINDKKREISVLSDIPPIFYTLLYEFLV